MFTNKLDGIASKTVKQLFESSHSLLAEKLSRGSRLDQWTKLIQDAAAKIQKSGNVWVIEDGVLVFTSKMCQFMQETLEQRTKRKIPMSDVKWVELSASGHSDYTVQLAIGCAELETRIKNEVEGLVIRG